MTKFRDLTGRTFGRLSVLHVDTSRPRKPDVPYVVRCECGTIKSIRGVDLVTGNTKSCGCIRREVAAERARKRNTTHGMSRRRLYHTWNNMVRRCSDPRRPDYPRYGGRGIKVCDRWLEPENFYADMGDPPAAAMSLDRIDNDGDYSPENCRWATISQQCRNQRKSILITYNGVTKPMLDWAEEFGLGGGTLKTRIFTLGWPVDKALLTPVKSKRRS